MVERRLQFGNMVLSRWPLRTARGHLLPRTWRKDRLNLQRGVLEVHIDTPVGPIRFYCTHFDHVDARERMAQVRTIRTIALDYPNSGGAITGARSYGLSEIVDDGHFVLMGDFNFEPDSDEYRLMTEDGATVDVAAGKDEGWSWRSLEAVDPVSRSRIDYAFCNATMARRIGGVRVDRTADGSDHMPLWVEIGG